MQINMNIINLKLNDIKPYWRNPRKNEKAVEAVKQSIQDYGFNQPILLDSKKVIIAGHTRYKALLELEIGIDTLIEHFIQLPIIENELGK